MHDGIQPPESSCRVTLERMPCLVFLFWYSFPYSAIAPGISVDALYVFRALQGVVSITYVMLMCVPIY